MQEPPAALELTRVSVAINNGETYYGIWNSLIKLYDFPLYLIHFDLKTCSTFNLLLKNNVYYLCMFNVLRFSL